MVIVENIRPCNKVRVIKTLLTSVGNKIGSVWFHKSSNGSLRKMAYRIKVSKPTYEKIPKGSNFLDRKSRDAEKNLLTVFDTNHVRHDDKGRINGRGAFKSIPLDSVIRMKVNGVIYKIMG